MTGLSNSIKRYSLSKQVSDSLEQMIEAGEYKIGEKIPPETELMELFDVSRNTIREAIRALTSAGILVVKQGDGTYVKSANRFNASMNLKYKQLPFDDVSEARHAMEITISQLAAERRTDEDLESIRLAFHNRKDANHSIEEDSIADFNFHKAIAKSCHNSIIYDLYMSISSFIQEQILSKNENPSTNSDLMDSLHEDLFHAIENKDPEKARIAIESFLKI